MTRLTGMRAVLYPPVLTSLRAGGGGGNQPQPERSGPAVYPHGGVLLLGMTKRRCRFRGQWGPGTSMERTGRMFQPNSRVATTRPSPGTGTALSTGSEVGVAPSPAG